MAELRFRTLAIAMPSPSVSRRNLGEFVVAFQDLQMWVVGRFVQKSMEMLFKLHRFGHQIVELCRLDST